VPEQRITAIETQERRGNRRSIFVDGKFALGVDETIVADLGLRVGQVISEEELKSVVHAELVVKAKEKALTFLEYRQRSRAEVSGRLMKHGFSDDIIEEVLKRLEVVGLLNDAEFSQSWVNHRVSGSMGKKRIKWELRRKGVSQDVAEEAVSSIDDDTEYRSALESASRRWNKDRCTDEYTRRRKLVSYLQRQGFGWELISRILNELKANDEPEWT